MNKRFIRQTLSALDRAYYIKETDTLTMYESLSELKLQCILTRTEEKEVWIEFHVGEDHQVIYQGNIRELTDSLIFLREEMLLEVTVFALSASEE